MKSTIKIEKDLIQEDQEKEDVVKRNQREGRGQKNI